MSSKKTTKKRASTPEEETFAIRVVNTLTYRSTKLTITKKYTILNIQEAFAPFESHPEYYLWQDMFGNTLELDKTVVENKLVKAEEKVEFDGIGKEPCILLVFKDGFENDKLVSLNPMMINKYSVDPEGTCRNY